MLIPSANAAVTELHVYPENPVVGDTITISGKATPGESINAVVSFEKTVEVSEEEYKYKVGSVEIPEKGKNRFSVTATDVEELWVSVKLFGIIPWTISTDAEGGTATISQSNVPGGTHEVKIGGLSENGKTVDLLISAALTIDADPNGHFEYPYTTDAIPAGDFELDVGSVEKTVTLSTAQSDGMGSSGGNGDSGSTGENYANIVEKEVKKEYVNKDSGVTYDFENEGNAIDYVKFTALKNSGTITATVEVLKGKSSFADSEPAGNVYQNMNIWVGNSGFSESGNIKDTSIGFKVAKSWILENNIIESSIRLCRFNSDVWDQLSTEKVGEDDEYAYFEADTLGFSAFAITGFTEEEELEAKYSVPEQNIEVESSVENEDVPAPEAQDTPGLGIVAISGLLACAYLAIRRN